MKKKYILKPKFLGKVVYDVRGKHVLTEKMTQKQLKDLYITGHTEKIDLVEYEPKQDSSDSGSDSE